MQKTRNAKKHITKQSNQHGENKQNTANKTNSEQHKQETKKANARNTKETLTNKEHGTKRKTKKHLRTHTKRKEQTTHIQI